MTRIYLSKREQQIMEIVHERGEATATDVEEALGHRLSNATVRSHLRTLEAKGHICHIEDGARFVYRPVRESEAEGRSALGAVVKTFFGGSLTHVVSALLDERKDRLSPEELSELERIVREAKEAGR